MWLPLLGMIAGILIGSMLALSIPGAYVKYLSVAVLASLDSVFGGIKALLEEKFDGAILLSGFFTNALLAALLAYLGDRLGVDLYLAAVFAFGVRLFQNLAIIRRKVFEHWIHKKRQHPVGEEKDAENR
ncbi:MAG: Uncharacterized protein XD63_1370 [Thermoanaerobacterales bacterium 50_218]|nr:MAG: Uncharacterized protein XD63_1370 [Thermoanaerobacterales bacterium 50_218]HAA90086.1 DUF1290 domain-containing protein [Peptococcaceae bacterium]